MPLLEQQLSVVVRSVKAFLNLQAGITRGGTAPPWSSQAQQSQELEEARRLLASKDRELAALRARPADNGTITESTQRRLEDSPGLAHYEARSPEPQEPLRADQLIWMFGQPRSGSTWLSWMMAELENQERWHEPYVGLLFGGFIHERVKDAELKNNPTFIMGEPYREVWLRSIRNFILEGAAARYPELKEDQYLVVKEPNGSIGAPLMMEALPESRMIFLIRDPRDVTASRIDGFRKGSWGRQERDYSAVEELNKHTNKLAQHYLRVVSKVQEAYEAHPGEKALVRYEDLRSDTVNVLKAMYDALKVETDEVQLEAAVKKHSWENIPEEKKGKDKFFRKAQAGGWREDLSSEQIKIVEGVTAPLLSKYY